MDPRRIYVKIRKNLKEEKTRIFIASENENLMQISRPRLSAVQKKKLKKQPLK